MRLFLATAFLTFLSLQSLATPQGPYSKGIERGHVKRGPGGWSYVKFPKGSTIGSISIHKGEVELFALTKKDLDKSKLKRIIFVVHGMGRDPWNYYNHMTTALHDAHNVGLVQHVHEVGIWAPGFWNNQDEGVWPQSELRSRSLSHKQLVWRKSSWVYGGKSQYPAGHVHVSSFAAIDEAIRYFGNKILFPKVETIVLAGHSAGGQMLHRYAQLGSHPSIAAELHFYIANPASYLYLDGQRPEKGIGGAHSRTHCNGYNDYKYGLNSVDEILRYNSPHPSNDAIYERYKRRHVHYQLGTADHFSETTRCEALVQGNNHLNRGRIYQAYLELLGYPKRHTIDYVAGVGHDDLAMFKSYRGMHRLFVESHARGRSIPSSQDRTHGLNVTFTKRSSKGEEDMPGDDMLL